jgi:hypothetical protein
MRIDQQRPDRLHENVDRQRYERRADELECQTLPALFEPLQLPDHDDRREDFDGTIKPETGKAADPIRQLRSGR